MIAMSLTAAQAKERAQLPGTLIAIENRISEASAHGLGGIDVNGQLRLELDSALNDAGYETTWRPEKKATWIYWGN